MKTSTYGRLSVICVLLSIALWPIYGHIALVGTMLGLLSGGLGIFLLIAFVNLISNNHANRKSGVLLTFIGFLIKVPIIIGAAYMTYRIDPIAIWPFTIAMVVVYFTMIWQASRQMLN